VGVAPDRERGGLHLRRVLGVLVFAYVGFDALGQEPGGRALPMGNPMVRG
jgi:hypothetical protein